MKGTSAHVALELTHVEPVDQRSGTRKADGVWHFWERAGQRHDALKRVAQTPECRLLFLVGVKHVQVDARLRPPVEGAGPFSSTSLLQLAAVEQLRAMNEVWNLGPQTPSGGWRAIKVDMSAA